MTVRLKAAARTLLVAAVLLPAAAAPPPARWLHSLPLREQAAQLVFLPFYGEAPNSQSPEYGKYLGWVRELRIGGLVLVNRVEGGLVRHAQPHAMAVFLNRMQRVARIPLLVAGDFERGASMRVDCETRFPHNMAFAAAGDPALSRAAGAITARQARALGVHWVLAPVADVNNNPDNPIINIRSYGEDPAVVAAHVTAFLAGLRSDPRYPVITTVKHFPGHGDTATDSHLGLPVLAADRQRLERVELVPFRAAIRAGVDTIMTAHIALPALDASGIPATLSAAILTGLLRQELGFTGLIVSDALDMQGVTKHFSAGQAAVKALEAGADVLLMPADPEAAIQAVVEAVQQGRLSRRRLQESVARVLALKARLRLDRRRLVDVEAISEHLDAPEALRHAAQVAERAITLLKNEGGLLPLGGAAAFLVLPENRGSVQGRRFAQEVRQRAPQAVLAVLDPAAPETELEQAATRAAEAGAVVVAAFVSAAAYRGNVALAGGYPRLMEKLLAAGKPVALVALGSPYLLRSFPGVTAYLATYSTAPPSEAAAVRALFGEIAIQGRLPVTIPGLARRGEGIQVSR